MVEVNLTKEQWEDLQRVKELVSHTNTNPSVSELIGLLTKNYLDKRDPLRKVAESKITFDPDASMHHPQMVNEDKASKQQKKENRSKADELLKSTDKRITKSSANNRYIPQKIKQAIFTRDQSCQWVTKKRNQQGEIEITKCKSKFQMQIDHIQPKWLNGTNEASNLQLLCVVHNKLSTSKDVYEEIIKYTTQ